MELVELAGLRAYRFPRLAGFPEVVHGVFTRQGGVSEGPYYSLNVGPEVGDLPGRVAANLRLIEKALGVKQLVGANQVHGRREAVIRASFVPSSGAMPEADILITATPGVGLLIRQADCQAVMFYDPEHRVVANTHCGWRGQVQGVLAETVARLAFHFGSRPEVLHAAVGPGLGPCCAEFVNYRREFPPELWRYQRRPGFFDLWQLSFDQLVAAGLKPQHIEVARLCTRCRHEEFFSFRRDKVTGRQAAVIALKW